MKMVYVKYSDNAFIIEELEYCIKFKVNLLSRNDYGILKKN